MKRDPWQSLITRAEQLNFQSRKASEVTGEFQEGCLCTALNTTESGQDHRHTPCRNRIWHE